MENILRFNRKVSNSRCEEFSEEDIIKKSVRGDCDAFGILLKKNKEYLYKTAYLYVKDNDKALDILQECTYLAFKNIKSLREPKYFKTWITRILINIAVKSLKEDKKTIYLDDNNPLKFQVETFSLDEKIDLYNAIDLLKEDYKSVIIMKYFNDMSVEEISNILDLPSNTVKTRLSRARLGLKKILKEDYSNE